MKQVLIFPDEYRGKFTKSCGFTKSNPRRWTDEEILWIKNAKENGYSNKEISLACGRTEVSLSIKLKRLGKKNESYNEPHREEKYKVNQEFLNLINPKTILDLYSGEKSFYNKKIYKVITNDIDIKFNTDYNEKAEKLICKLYYENKKYDLIDIDPFGSAFDCFDLAIKMAKRGLIITLGEMGHIRFNRLDYVKRYYGIYCIEDFTSGRIVDKIIKIGERNKKKLIPFRIMDWKGISRVYFKIEKLRITEQWE